MAAKENLQAKLDNEEEAESARGHREHKQVVVKINSEAKMLQNTSAVVQFKGSLGKAKSTSEERARILQNSVDLL